MTDQLREALEDALEALQIVAVHDAVKDADWYAPLLDRIRAALAAEPAPSAEAPGRARGQT
jgi:hypothetical protein